MSYEPIPGQPQYATEEETLSVIRSVLTQDEDVASTGKQVHDARPASDLGDKEQIDHDASGKTMIAFVERTTMPHPRRRSDDLPVLADIEHITESPKKSPRRAPVSARLRQATGPLLQRFGAFRPSTRHLALACLALAVVLRPHWFLITGVLSVACCVGLFLILGSDGVWRGVVSYLARVDARDPARGAKLRARLDRMACLWDGVLDRFPDGMVDALYMPDLQAMESAEAAHIDALDRRLDRMAHDA
ncbi:MAG: hypothetical protein AAF252_08650 [Pseudomonadota bacterium]